MTDNSTRYPSPPDGHPTEDLSALLDNELETAPRAELEAHLASCDGCRGDYEQLAATRAVMRRLVTTAPAGASSAAVAAALDAVGESAEASAERPPAGRLVTLRGPQRRIRALRIAAGIVLAAGVGSGIGLGLSHVGGSATSDAGRAAVAAPAHGKSAPSAATASKVVLQLRESTGRILTSLGRNEVAGIRIEPAGGGAFTATITLGPRHLLAPRTLEALRAGGVTAVLSRQPADGSVAVEPPGEHLSAGAINAAAVHVVSRQVLEITGLSKRGSLDLERLLD